MGRAGGEPAVSRQRAGWRPVPVWVVVTTAMLVLAGCGSTPPAPAPTPIPTPMPTSSESSPNAPATTTPPMPPDGIRLAALGVRNGPVEFSLPRSAVVASEVDQPNNVVLVLTAPTSTQTAEYLRRALPPSGFTLGPVGETFTFSGHGWSGSFTSSAGSSVILLRPA